MAKQFALEDRLNSKARILEASAALMDARPIGSRAYLEIAALLREAEKFVRKTRKAKR